MTNDTVCTPSRHPVHILETDTDTGNVDVDANRDAHGNPNGKGDTQGERGLRSEEPGSPAEPTLAAAQPRFGDREQFSEVKPTDPDREGFVEVIPASAPRDRHEFCTVIAAIGSHETAQSSCQSFLLLRAGGGL